MPGYYVHLAASNKKARKNRSFVCGVETPDLLKYYLSTYGIVGAKNKYNIIKTTDMPDFSYFEYRLQQEERNNLPVGMHYGCSSNPNVLSFWNSLTETQKTNPFYIGYLWHLLTDLLMYSYLDIDSKFNDFKNKHLDDKNLNNLLLLEVDKLHTDWDKTNAKIRDTYPDVIIPQEIKELNIIKFLDDNQTSYVDWNIIKSLTDYMRLYNPLSDNIDSVIDSVLKILPDSKNVDMYDTPNNKIFLSKH